MSSAPQGAIDLREDRFSRFRSIAWWDQALMRDARVLVVGAGALGNEVIKNLSLLGVANVVVVDMDKVEASNLSRSVLFRAVDEGRFKADCAAATAREIYPEMSVVPIVGNLLSDVGFGYFRWAQVVVGALDNREARVFVNQACAQVGRPWIDGGIEVLNGIVRGFAPPATACYECTMSQRDWEQINQRRSCSLLARRALSHGGIPTTPTTASIIGAMQAQEVVKSLHGLETLAGKGFVFEGLTHSSYPVDYPISPDCPWHGDSIPVETTTMRSSTTLHEVWDYAAKRLGPLDAIDLSRELIESFECPSCDKRRDVFQPIDRVPAEESLCDACQTECVPRFFHSVAAGSHLLEKTVGGLGLPAWDVLWPRSGASALGVELAGDRPESLRS